MKYKFSLLAFLFITTFPNAQTITTIGGTGSLGYTPDGVPAINATLGDMYYCHVAFDKSGNMYFSETGYNIIRKVSTAGIITTIAGTYNVIGSSGNGGLAVNALLYHPTTIAVDNNDNIYFADANGSYIRKIDPAGIITRITGTETINCGVGDGGPVAQAQFRAISAITLDNSGNLFVADYGCNTVRKISTAGIVTTIAGNGTHGYSGDGGPATSAQLGYPTKVAIDNAGNVYIPDAHNHRVRKVDNAGIITTVIGNGIQGYSGDGGSATSAQISFPGSVVIDNAGNLYIGDYNQVIRKIDPSGIITTYAGNGISGYSGDGGPAINASIFMTEGRISIDENNNIYFIDANNAVIRKISNCLTASITQHPQPVSVCNTGDASFSISATGANSIKWQVNNGTGWSDITDNAVYSGSTSLTLNISGANVNLNNFKYRCMLTNPCGSVFSQPALLAVTTPVTPTVSISTTTTTICAGTSTTFTAAPLNEGTNPSFQWQKNNLPVGSNSATYTDNSINNGDVISCILTSSQSCVSGSIANSNSITMTVNPILSPTITISASDNNICTGSMVVFSSTVQDEGANPSYQWRKNGVNTGNNSPSYSDNTLADGDIISCILITNYNCQPTPSVESNLIGMNILPLVTPSITISTPSTRICPGTSVTFTATPSNGGPSPVYQWKKNGTLVGTGNNTYSVNDIANNDIIVCEMIATGACLSTTTVTSNPINISFYSAPIVTLDKTPYLCEGDGRLLNAGSFSSYIWNNGSTSSTIFAGIPGKYYVTVTDNNGCQGSDTTIISQILPKPTGFLPPDTSICSYGTLTLQAKAGYNSYLWSNNSTSSTIEITTPGLYWLQVTDKNQCKNRDTVLVNLKQCMEGFYIPSGFTPNNDGKNDTFKPFVFGNVESYLFIIYNRWGQVVFQSSDLYKGWDGRFNGQMQDSHVFVWSCKYKLQGGVEVIKKGTVTIIR